MFPLVRLALALIAAAARQPSGRRMRAVPAPARAEVDSAVYVWIQPRADVPGWHADDVAQARRAFEAWNGIVPWLHFFFVDDSVDAPVHVVWRNRFAESMSGQSRVTRDASGRVTEATVTLAVHHPDGRPVEGAAMRALAMHEVGHLLGLPHSTDPRSIMAPVVRVRTLSREDSAALRGLHAAEGRE